MKKKTVKATAKKKPSPKTKVKATRVKSKAKITRKKKAEKTHIIAIIDQSTSMARVASQAIEGFNAFLDKQKKLKDKATMNVVLFSSHNRITPLYDDRILDVHEVQELNNQTYQPNGCTALNDAIVLSLTSFKLKENQMKPSQRPDKVLVIIVTDGEENDSREYPKWKIDEVKALITKRKSENWQFMFLCSTEDAALTGEALGVSQGNVFKYTNDTVGNAVMFDTMAFAASSYRGMSTKEKDFSIKSANLVSSITTTDDLKPKKKSISKVDDADDNA